MHRTCVWPNARARVRYPGCVGCAGCARGGAEGARRRRRRWGGVAEGGGLYLLVPTLWPATGEPCVACHWGRRGRAHWSHLGTGGVVPRRGMGRALLTTPYSDVARGGGCGMSSCISCMSLTLSQPCVPARGHQPSPALATRPPALCPGCVAPGMPCARALLRPPHYSPALPQAAHSGLTFMSQGRGKQLRS